jgi:hypothetical protein
VKSNVMPAPQPTPPAAAAQTYLCYKAKCPKVQPTATLNDQFGTHAVTVKSMSLLCAPVAGPTTTTTTTTSTTSTTMAGCTMDNQCSGTINSCQHPACMSGTCGTFFAPAGTPTGMQTSGDCQQVVCDGMGGTTSTPDNSDVPADDGNQCTFDTCVSGAPAHPFKPQGSPCSQGGGTVCNASGTCVQCLTASQCPGTDTDCQQRICSMETCGFVNAPMGTPLSMQTPGDCQQAVCDGMGGTTSVADNSDVPADDGNQCTQETCVSGTPAHPFQPMGFPCSQNGGNHCDGMGSCVP